MIKTRVQKTIYLMSIRTITRNDYTDKDGKKTVLRHACVDVMFIAHACVDVMFIAWEVWSIKIMVRGRSS